MRRLEGWEPWASELINCEEHSLTRDIMMHLYHEVFAATDPARTKVMSIQAKRPDRRRGINYSSKKDLLSRDTASGMYTIVGSDQSTQYEHSGTYSRLILTGNSLPCPGENTRPCERTLVANEAKLNEKSSRMYGIVPGL